MEYYRKRVEFYFESEYSDIPLDQVADHMRVLQEGEADPSELVPTTFGELEDSDLQAANRAKWDRKVEQVVRAYYDADKPPQEAAQKLAKILNSYTSQPLLRKR